MNTVSQFWNLYISLFKREIYLFKIKQIDIYGQQLLCTHQVQCFEETQQFVPIFRIDSSVVCSIGKLRKCEKASWSLLFESSIRFVCSLRYALADLHCLNWCISRCMSFCKIMLFTVFSITPSNFNRLNLVPYIHHPWKIDQKQYWHNPSNSNSRLNTDEKWTKWRPSPFFLSHNVCFVSLTHPWNIPEIEILISVFDKIEAQLYFV